MSQALDLYERVRDHLRSHVTVGTPETERPSQVSHAHASVESHVGSSEPLSLSAPARARDSWDAPVCPHVTEEWLAYWYAEHPEVTCARCWLEAHGRGIREAESAGGAGGVDKSTCPGDAAHNCIATRYFGGDHP